MPETLHTNAVLQVVAWYSGTVGRLIEYIRVSNEQFRAELTRESSLFLALCERLADCIDVVDVI